MGRAGIDLDVLRGVFAEGAAAMPFELSEHVERVYRRALDRYGPVDGELLAVAMLEEQAGVRLRSETT